MTRFVAGRVAWMIAILIGVSLVAFFLMRALPGDFAIAAAGSQSVAPETLAAIRRDLGLDRPLAVQYASWLGRALVGDLGTSFVTRQPVAGELFGRLAVTFQLTLIASVIAMIIGMTSGIAAARMKGATDWILRIYNGVMLAIPNYVIATLIVLLFGLYFPQISIFGYTPFFEDPISNISSLLLPALALALGVAVTISENTRAAVLEVASQDFVMVARAKGLRKGVILRDYLMRNALTPIITATGLKVAALLGGSILVETIFAIPGLGQYLFDSINSRNYPAIQAVVLLAAAIVVCVNTIIDIAYARVDARVQI